MKKIVGKSWRKLRFFVKNQVGRMSLGVEEPGVEEGQEAVSKVTIGEWIMDYDDPTFRSTWLQRIHILLQ